MNDCTSLEIGSETLLFGSLPVLKKDYWNHIVLESQKPAVSVLHVALNNRGTVLDKEWRTRVSIPGPSDQHPANAIEFPPNLENGNLLVSLFPC